MKQQGWQQKQIAEAFGAGEEAVSQRLKKARERGEEALRTCPALGVPSRMTPSNKSRSRLLAKRAEGYGFRGYAWTASRVAKVIENTFGIRDSRNPVGKLLQTYGWSRQKPEEQATQRKEEVIRNGKRPLQKSRAGGVNAIDDRSHPVGFSHKKGLINLY